MRERERQRQRRRDWETETECEQGRDREGQRHRIWSRIHTLSCQHRAPCGARTHKVWYHDLSQSRMLNWLSHWGTPCPFFILSRWQTLMIHCCYCYCCLMFIYFERERVSESGEGAKRKEERIPGRLHTVSTEPDDPTNREMTWAKIKSRMLNPLSHTQVPQDLLL